MKLRSRIMIITFLIILFVQGLNCFLEVGFLANNLEEANLRKYRIIGTEMKRKISTSLIFGKPLAHIDYTRLLSDILPEDVDNLYIIDTQGGTVYAARKGAEATGLNLSTTFLNEKTPEAYRIFFPLTDRNGIKGNLVIIVSHQEVKEKRLYLIRKSIFNFLWILAIFLPVFYAMLTVFINRPYNRFIKDINALFRRGDYRELAKSGIDLTPLSEAEAALRKVRAAAWLSPENLDDDTDVDDKNKFVARLKTLMKVN